MSLLELVQNIIKRLEFTCISLVPAICRHSSYCSTCSFDAGPSNKLECKHFDFFSQKR